MREQRNCRRKCQQTIGPLSTEQAYRLCRFSWGELPFAELQLYNLRHVQEHGAQLRMFLGQQAGNPQAGYPRLNKKSPLLNTIGKNDDLLTDRNLQESGINTAPFGHTTRTQAVGQLLRV